MVCRMEQRDSASLELGQDPTRTEVSAKDKPAQKGTRVESASSIRITLERSFLAFIYAWATFESKERNKPYQQ